MWRHIQPEQVKQHHEYLQLIMVIPNHVTLNVVKKESILVQQ